MPAPDLLARELLARELAEEPEARAARQAHQRWVTHLRLWAAMDRGGITDPGEQARFISRSLWPELRRDVVDAFAEAVRDNTRAGRPLRRPEQARDVVGVDLERLLITYGYLEPDPGG